MGYCSFRCLPGIPLCFIALLQRYENTCVEFCDLNLRRCSDRKCVLIPVQLLHLLGCYDNVLELETWACLPFFREHTASDRYNLTLPDQSNWSGSCREISSLWFSSFCRNKGCCTPIESSLISICLQHLKLLLRVVHTCRLGNIARRFGCLLCGIFI